jgi:cell division GTPase FtsZ
MKIVVIGLGQCGGRIADEFAKLNNKAKRQRGIEIVTGAFAVNTDAEKQEATASAR